LATAAERDAVALGVIVAVSFADHPDRCRGEGNAVVGEGATMKDRDLRGA
jgi:hypothetical protein